MLRFSSLHSNSLDRTRFYYCISALTISNKGNERDERDENIYHICLRWFIDGFANKCIRCSFELLPFATKLHRGNVEQVFYSICFPFAQYFYDHWMNASFLHFDYCISFANQTSCLIQFFFFFFYICTDNIIRFRFMKLSFVRKINTFLLFFLCRTKMRLETAAVVVWLTVIISPILSQVRCFVHASSFIHFRNEFCCDHKCNYEERRKKNSEVEPSAILSQDFSKILLTAFHFVIAFFFFFNCKINLRMSQIQF